MTGGESRHLPRGRGEDLITALIDRYEISREDVSRIEETMHETGVSWIEAAALNGLLTPAQIEAVSGSIQRGEGIVSEGLVEKAIRRSIGKALVHVQGPEVQPGSRLIFAHDPYNPRSEKIRALRAELLLLNDTSTMILAILGCGPQEGRSVLAAELAMAFGQLGRLTLLVDADMRKPSLHHLFQTENTSGLAQSIEGPQPGIMYSVAGLPAVSLLTAGVAASNPLELLSDQRFNRLVDSWRNKYEFVIIDTPPVSRFADGLTAATRAGRVLVVSRSVTTRFSDLKEMLRRIALTRSHVLGAVINHF